nr:hypothetical protein [Brevundimonas naejangsanensis]
MGSLTPDQMVKVIAIAPFEIAEAMALWASRARADADAHAAGRSLSMADEEASRSWANGLGAPTPYSFETDQAFGERVAAAIHTLIKEI